MPAPDLTALTEAALAVALAGAVEAVEPGRWQSEDAVGHTRTARGGEIDFAPVPVLTPAAPT